MAGPTGTLGTIETLTIGGRVLASVSTLIHLIAYSDGGNGSTFRKMDGTSGYTPSGATAFKLKAIKVVGENAYTNARISYSTNDVGMNTGTAFAGQVNIGGNTSIHFSTGAAPFVAEFAVDFTVPNADFLGMQPPGGSNTTVMAYGYEV